MAQRRCVYAPTHQDGCPEASAQGESAVPDCIHAAVDLVQPAAPDTGLDRSAAQAGGMKLSRRNDAVLAFGQIRDHQISTRGEKFSSILYFSPHVADRPAAGAPRPPR